MKLRRVSVRRLPGLTQPFDVADLSHEVVVIIGPNGSGKSSLCRCVKAALWPEEGLPDPSDVAVVWEHDGGDLKAEIGRRVSWQIDGVECAPPPLPGRHLAGCFTLGLRALLSADGESDRDLAERILVLMEGSNVRAVRERFALKRSHGEKEERALRSAERELSRVRSDQSSIAEQADRLQSLEERLAQAQTSVEEAPLLELALKRADLEAACKRAEVLLGDFPPGMERLKGDESDRLAQMDSDIEAATSRSMQQKRVVAAAEAEMAACGLREGAIDVGALNSWLERARELDGRERDLRAAHEEEAAARESLILARAELAGEIDPESCGEIDGAALDAVAHWVGEAQDIDARRAALEAEREALRSTDEAAREGRRVGTNTRRTTLVGLVLVVSGAVLAWAATPWLIALAGLGVGLLLMPLRRREPRTGGDLAALKLQYVQQKLTSLAGDEGALQQRREALCAQLGVDPGVSDLRLSDLATSLKRWREVGDRHARTRGILDQREQECAQRLSELQEFLRSSTGQVPGDASQATGMLESLKDRGARFARARTQKEAAQQVLTETEDRLRQLRERQAALLRECVPDEEDQDSARAALTGRLRRLDGWREADKDRDRLAWELKTVSAGLGEREDLASLSAADAQARITACKEAARTVPSLHREIESIRTQVRQVSRGDAFELGLAAREAARIALTRRRHEDLHAAAGRLLLDQVRQEYEQKSHPEVLKRARRFFARFTRNRYELKVDPDGGGFRAYDAARGTGMGLAELSDGERVQLLLSARLAFATHAEDGLVLPLFLDEALTNADGDRFRAVCESLLELAQGGRQIIYLTANASDVEHWRAISRELGRPEPHVVDLGEVRGIASSVATAADLAVTQPERVPVPGGRTPEEYGLDLRVPPIDPHAPIEAMHLFHVLRPDLELLHRLVAGASVRDVGSWRMLDHYGGAASFATADERRRIDALIDLTGSFLEAWRVGRGRPLDRTALAASGAVSDHFLERLSSLAWELGGSSERLLAAIEARQDERVHRFKGSKLEDLRFYLEAHGYLDARPPLEPERVMARVLGSLRDVLVAGALAPERATSKIRELQSLLDPPQGSDTRQQEAAVQSDADAIEGEE